MDALKATGLCRAYGKGAGGLRGGAPGDLYVVLNVRDSDVFEREDTDLFVTVPISPVLAALGGSVDIPTPDGVATVSLPAGTPNGKQFRLRGKGRSCRRPRGARRLRGAHAPHGQAARCA